MGHSFIRNSVIALDKTLQTIQLATGEILPYDHLILAIGNSNTLSKVAGASQYAFSFDSINDAENAAFQLQRLDSLSLASRPIVLVGASIEGLEVLGEIIRRYQRQWRFKLYVVDAAPVLMANYQGLDAYLKQKCAHLDIERHLGQSVKQVNKDSVELSNGDILPSRVTLWCAGAMPLALLVAAGLTAAHDTLHIVDTHIWLAGDCAELPIAIAKQAYHALPMGKLVAQNIKRHQQNRRLSPFNALPIPSLMSFGEMGFLLAKSHALASPSFIAAKEGVFQANFNLIKQPSHSQEWLGLKNSLQQSGLNMAKLAKNT